MFKSAHSFLHHLSHFFHSSCPCDALPSTTCIDCGSDLQHTRGYEGVDMHTFLLLKPRLRNLRFRNVEDTSCTIK
jgi:hypothetical protein